MLDKLDILQKDLMNLIVYTNSASLQSFMRSRIKERYQIPGHLIHSVDNSAELKSVKSNCINPPFGGGLWLIHVQADKIPLKEITKYIAQSNLSSITVYWLSNYKQFKTICDLKVLKELNQYSYTMYAGKLYAEDITYLHNHMLPEELRMKKDLLQYVKKNYTYDVQAVCDLFENIKQGEEVSSRQDIINMVGIGGNTIDNFVIKLLTINPKTQKGVQKTFENMLKLFRYLSYTYPYSTLKNYMKASLNTIMEIKQLQVMGRYSVVMQDIPEDGFHPDRYARMRRFEKVILEDINIARVLNLRIALNKYNNFNSEIALIQSLSDYIGVICANNINNPDSKEKKKK